MKIKKIVIHCSDTPNGRPHTAEDIHRWHLERGWDGIGYHHVIGLKGEIESGRPHYWMGSHVAGHNKNTIGICLIGRDTFTTEQCAVLTYLVNDLIKNNPDAEVVGHYELDPKKTCPNFDVQSWWKEAKTEMDWG